MSAKKKDDVVKPQIIDLDADAVSEIADKPMPHSEQIPEPPPKSPQKRKNINWLLPAAALVAGAIGGGWFYKDVLLDYFPPAQVTAAQQSIAKLEQQQAGVSGSVTQLQQSIQQQDTGTSKFKAELTANADATAAAVKSIQARIDQLEPSLARLAQDVAKLKSQPAMPGISAAAPIELGLIEQRLAALEKQVEQLRAAKPPANQVLAAFTALRNKIAAGEPFELELKSFAAATPAIAIPQEISASAAKGASTPPQLGAELRAASATLTTSPEPEESGLWSSIKKTMSGLVTIRNEGPADWSSTIETAASLAEANNLEQAIAALEDAGTPPPAITSWIEKAKARIVLDRAMGSWTATVMQQAAGP